MDSQSDERRNGSCQATLNQCVDQLEIGQLWIGDRVERVQRNDQERDPEKRDDEGGPDPEPDASRSRLHHKASNAPSRFATAM